MNLSITRVAILGSPGSGKSTTATRLGKILDLPVIHLDELFWNTWKDTPNPTADQRAALLNEVAQRPQWIIDGNHGQKEWRNVRLDAADMLLYLDIAPWICVWRIIRRRLTVIGKSRAQLRPYEWLSWGMIQAAWNFRQRGLADEVTSYASSKQVSVLHSPTEVDDFLKQAHNTVFTGCTPQP